jgi:hypothetical protein
MTGYGEMRYGVFQRREEISEMFAGFGAATGFMLGRSVATSSRRWLGGVTLLLGLLGVAAVVVGGRPIDGTFVHLSDSVQSLMSITLPFFGVLLARDVLRSRGEFRLAPTLLAAALLAAATALVGIVICAGAVTVVPSGSAVGRWNHAASVAACSLLVQIVAQSVGTGLGFLLRPAVLACLATMVLPLGLWFVLGSVDVLRPAQAWLTPYATVRNLLSGHMDALGWAQWSVVVLVWGIALNAVGASRVRRRPVHP